jgi:hypothetical protein
VRTTWKPLTSLLVISFLFLFSGSVYGGVFDKKNGVVVLRCLSSSGEIDYYSVNIKDKVIKTHTFGFVDSSHTYKITKEDEIQMTGSAEEEMVSITITKHKYENAILLRHFWINNPGQTNKTTGKTYYECVVGEKVF